MRSKYLVIVFLPNRVNRYKLQVYTCYAINSIAPRIVERIKFVNQGNTVIVLSSTFSMYETVLNILC